MIRLRATGVRLDHTTKPPWVFPGLPICHTVTERA